MQRCLSHFPEFGDVPVIHSGFEFRLIAGDILASPAASGRILLRKDPDFVPFLCIRPPDSVESGDCPVAPFQEIPPARKHVLRILRIFPCHQGEFLFILSIDNGKDRIFREAGFRIGIDMRQELSDSFPPVLLHALLEIDVISEIAPGFVRILGIAEIVSVKTAHGIQIQVNSVLFHAVDIIIELVEIFLIEFQRLL